MQKVFPCPDSSCNHARKRISTRAHVLQLCIQHSNHRLICCILHATGDCISSQIWRRRRKCAEILCTLKFNLKRFSTILIHFYIHLITPHGYLALQHNNHWEGWRYEIAEHSSSSSKHDIIFNQIVETNLKEDLLSWYQSIRDIDS